MGSILNTSDLKKIRSFIQNYKKVSSVEISTGKILSTMNKFNSQTCTGVKKIDASVLIRSVDQLSDSVLSGAELAGMIETLESQGKLFKGKTLFKSYIEGGIKEGKEYTDYLKKAPKRADNVYFKGIIDDAIQEYMANFSTAMGELEKYGRDDVDTLSIDAEFMKPSYDTLKQSYTGFLSQIALLKTIQHDGISKGTEEENAIAAIIAQRIQIENKTVKNVSNNLQESTNTSRALKRNVETEVRETLRAYESRLNEFAGIPHMLKSGDIKGIFSSLGRALALPKGKKEKNGMNKAVDAVEQEVEKADSGMAGLMILEMALKTIKVVIGMLFGLDEHATEFNQAMVDKHGLTSMGALKPVITNADDIKNVFSKYQNIIDSYGPDTKTFLTREDIDTVISAYENEGGRMHQIASSREKMTPYFNTVLQGKYMLGMSLEESSNIVAEWTQQLGFEISDTSNMLDVLAYNTASTGLPTRFFLESLKGLNMNYGMSADRYRSVLDLQRLAQQKGRMLPRQNQEAMDTLISRLRTMDESSFAKLVHPLIGSGRLRDIILEEITHLDSIARTATSEQQKAQAEYNRDVLKNSLQDDPYFAKIALRTIASEGTLVKVYSEGLQAHMGTDFKDMLEKGFLTRSVEATMGGILGLQGDTDTMEKFKEATYMLLNAPKNFASSPVHTALSQNYKNNLGKHKDLGSAIKESILQSTTSTEMRVAFFKKWLTQFLGPITGITNKLKNFWMTKIFGADPNKRPEIQAGIEQVRLMVKNIDAEKNVEKKAKLVKILEERLESLKALGADVSAIVIEIEEHPVSKEVLDLFSKYLSLSGGLGGPMGFGQYSGAMSMQGIDYDPMMAQKIVQTAIAKWGNNPKPRYRCYAGVSATLVAAIGWTPYGGSAWHAAEQLARSQYFREVRISSNADLTNAPPGSIVVHDRSPNPATWRWGRGWVHGHIEILVGGGKAISDFTGNIMYHHYGGGGRRLFVPVKSTSPSANLSAIPGSAERYRGAWDTMQNDNPNNKWRTVNNLTTNLPGVVADR